MSDPDYGPIQVDAFIQMAKNVICQPGQPWVTDETWPASDHGHTLCYFVGSLLALVLAQRAWIDQAYDELGDLRSQNGDDYLYQKHNERVFCELRDAYLRIHNTTF